MEPVQIHDVPVRATLSASDPKVPVLDSLLPWSPSLPLTCRIFQFLITA
ncbi:hypothetical protein GK047_27755 [Paenibacillus sp. SYP-B3998]|uniref:Uncharacterized protein n=1 Tax=Paenibacillus sp. SYP-B3998 TaxID=2678564 RepID=A0A6G4A5S2_9BACL|nr:hypothetical protein [Paenibacillus sp. SYP-B3998]